MQDNREESLIRSISFWRRTITGITLAAVLVLAFVLGYTVMLVVIGCLSLIGLWEFYKAKNLLWEPFAVIGFIADIFYYCVIRFFAEEYTTLYMVFLFAITLAAMICTYVLKYPKYELNQLFSAYFGIFYIGVMLSFLYLTRVHAWGAYLVWLAIIASWGSDTCAYLGGMLIGKHQAFPRLSPKKTIEGCICGVIGAGIIAFIYAYIVSDYILDIEHEMIIFPVVCMLGAAIGMGGDLFASAIKRSCGIKDYSNLLPGHGGVLDRFDSVILVAPIIYAITILIRYWS